MAVKDYTCGSNPDKPEVAVGAAGQVDEIHRVRLPVPQ